MAAQSPNRLPLTPPPGVKDAIQRRFSEREVKAIEAVFALRRTAQQADNAITEWMAGTVGSVARWQILVLLWASKGSSMPHKDIVAIMGVTRATVSGLMAALERDGLVQSAMDRDDRRQLLATLTSKGEAIIDQAIELNAGRIRAVLASLSSAELTTLTALLQRIREGFAASANAATR